MPRYKVFAAIDLGSTEITMKIAQISKKKVLPFLILLNTIFLLERKYIEQEKSAIILLKKYAAVLKNICV